jgi:hypothetical protein
VAGLWRLVLVVDPRQAVELIHEHQRVHRRNLEALAARLTGELVVDANQVVAQLGELGAVALVGIAGRPVLLGAPDPTQLVIVGAPAARTGVAARALFRTFVEEGAFVEGHAVI